MKRRRRSCGISKGDSKESSRRNQRKSLFFLPDLDDDDDVMFGDDDNVLLDDDELRYSTESLESEIMPMNLSTLTSREKAR